MKECILCDSSKIKDHIAYGDKVVADIVSDKTSLGMLGALWTGICIEADEQADTEYSLIAYSAGSNFYECHKVKTPIKYCPFCGRELGD